MTRMATCRDSARALGPYLDGECDPAQMIEIDEHVAGCDTCREEVQLLRAMRGSMKRVVRTPASAGLRDRISNAMTAELARDGHPERDADVFGPAPLMVRVASGRRMAPIAVAAAIALLWGTAVRGSATATKEEHAGFGDDLLKELVAEHSQPLPPEAITPQAVRGLERYVGVPIRPPSFGGDGARLVGGRVVPLRQQRAAMLQYVVGSGDDARRVSVFVYDAQKIEVGTDFTPRAVGTAEVRVGRERGYSVAATQRGGVGYLVASDLDQDKDARLAAMVYDDR
jgi:anti-sigma factor RsiW